MRLSSIHKIMVTVLVLFFWSCAAGPVTVEKGATIAVWDLEDVTPGKSALPDLGELLSAKIIETIKSSGDYTVVEREKLLLTLEELNLGSSELVDEGTRLKIGAMVGARMMIFGAYQVIGNMTRIDLRVIEVETGRFVEAGQKTVPATDLVACLGAAEALARELFDSGSP